VSPPYFFPPLVSWIDELRESLPLTGSPPPSREGVEEQEMLGEGPPSFPPFPPPFSYDGTRDFPFFFLAS